MDERRAINRLKHGQIDGLEALVTHYQVQAVRVAYLITGDPALAEDISQSAFVRAYEDIAQFDSSRPFAPWFLRIVAHIALKTLRHDRRMVSLDQDDGALWIESLPLDAPIPPEVVEAAEDTERLRAALDRLPPEQRAVIVLRYYAGLKGDQIASTLNIPGATVRWRLHAARKRLRDLLGGMFHPETDNAIEEVAR